MRYKRMLVKLGFHGKGHKLAIEKLSQWMHDQGIGA